MSQRLMLAMLFTGVVFAGACAGWAQEEAPESPVVPASYEPITSAGKYNMEPAVSPDGKRIAYSSNRTGNYDIFVRHLSEQGEIQRTSHPKHDQHPSWVGSDLVFESNRTGSWDLFRTRADEEGGQLQWSSRPGDETYASVHPETGRILYVARPKRGFFLSFGPRDADICVAEEDPNQSRVIAQGMEPRWSPDGKRVVFSSRRAKNPDIWVVSAEGGAATQLTTDRAADMTPCFSPSGSRIVFSSKRAGNYDLWVMEADGSRKTQLTTHPNDESEPFWAADGMIYFVFKEKTGSSNIYAIEEPPR